MEIIQALDVDYQAIAQSLREGNVIIYPTDTAYALGADATNAQGVARIFDVKQRDTDKTLSLIVADRAMAETWLEFSPLATELADTYWPGPLTLTLPHKKEGLMPETMHEGFVAVRMPNEEHAVLIAEALGAPIVSTSANTSGTGPQYSMQEVVASLADRAELVSSGIDAGMLPNKGVSTIVKVWNNTKEILREGVITL